MINFLKKYWIFTFSAETSHEFHLNITLERDTLGIWKLWLFTWLCIFTNHISKEVVQGILPDQSFWSEPSCLVLPWGAEMGGPTSYLNLPGMGPPSSLTTAPWDRPLITRQTNMIENITLPCTTPFNMWSIKMYNQVPNQSFRIPKCLFQGLYSNRTLDLLSWQKMSKFLRLCFGGLSHNESSEGNWVFKFPYFRKYSEITNISWPKVVFLHFVTIFSKLQTPQVKYLPELLIVSQSTEMII